MSLSVNEFSKIASVYPKKEYDILISAFDKCSKEWAQTISYEKVPLFDHIYIAHKLAELNKITSLHEDYILKTKTHNLQKIIHCDFKYKQICDKLGWKFIPTKV